MALQIYQIGNLVLPFYQQSVTNSYSTNSRGKLSESMSSPKYYTRNTRYMYAERTISIECILADAGHITADEAEQVLRSYVGIQLPIIAYDVNSETFIHYNEKNCTSCGNDDCCIVFLQCLGVITGISELQEDDWASPRTMTIELTLTTFWRGLDNALWRYGNYGFFQSNIYSDQETQEFYDLPSCGIFLNPVEKDYRSFLPQVYQDYLFMYNHDYLNDSITREGSCFSGVCRNAKFLDGQAYAKLGTKHKIDMSSKYWSAPPLGMVLITNFYDDSDVIIKNTWQEAGIYFIERQTTIDVEKTNEALVDNGYSILGSDDTVAMGDITYTKNGVAYRNAFIIRNNAVLSVQPYVIYPDFYPAMISPSVNSTITCFGNIGQFSYAYYFRRI